MRPENGERSSPRCSLIYSINGGRGRGGEGRGGEGFSPGTTFDGKNRRICETSVRRHIYIYIYIYIYIPLSGCPSRVPLAFLARAKSQERRSGNERKRTPRICTRAGRNNRDLYGIEVDSFD
jgi:hypothetical protein